MKPDEVAAYAEGYAGKSAREAGVPASEREDLIQEILMKTYARLLGIVDADVVRILIKGTRERDALRKATRSVLERWRRTKKKTQPEGLSEEPADTSLDFTRQVIDILLDARDGVGRLSDRELRCVRLRAFRGSSDQRIAEELGIDVRQVQQAYSRAVRKLRESYEGGTSVDHAEGSITMSNSKRERGTDDDKGSQAATGVTSVQDEGCRVEWACR